jgi:hypothetical protein
MAIMTGDRGSHASIFGGLETRAESCLNRKWSYGDEEPVFDVDDSETSEANPKIARRAGGSARVRQQETRLISALVVVDQETPDLICHRGIA